ncbi:MAG: hypothetical protein ABH844_02735 [Candidatus Omnitrophota bacterium]
MRTLIYVPVIHTNADMGSLAEDVSKKGIAELGRDFWDQHLKAVESFWDSLARYFDSMNVSGMKIYQDGMIAEGEVARAIVEEGVKLASKNYELVASFLKRGAVLVKTEDFSLVKKERDCIVRISRAKTVLSKLIAYFAYKMVKNGLLRKRDDYVIKRICETLDDEHTGILFMGAYHNILPKLSKRMRVIEIKRVNKVREYQRLFLCLNRDKEEFKKLTEYLTAPVE